MTGRLVYGLGIVVNVPIAGLAGSRSRRHMDVQVSLGSMPPFAAGPGGQWGSYYSSSDLDENGESSVRVFRSADGNYFRIAYTDGTDMVVDAEGRNVWATWAETSSAEDAATYLLGPVLGFVLRLRGITVLHASAVAIDGRAVALVGPSGSGKSTTAAAFARQGCPVFTDDVLALVDREHEFDVQPAYPRLRLWPSSVESLFGAEDALPLIAPGWDKRYLDLNGPQHQFQHEPLPLAAVYILGDRSDGRAPRIEDVCPQDGLMSLIANSYATNLLDRSMRAREFELLGRLVAHVPIRRATPDADFGKLPQLCDAITDDVRQLVSAAGR